MSMKEKIDLFAKGVFSYDKPGITSSESNINISAEMGKSERGSFFVSSLNGKAFKGIAYSGNNLLKLQNSFFNGAQNEIEYVFDAAYLDINDTVKGHISIVSEYGELEIPFHAKVKVPSCETSIGPASDLFHFAGLAQSNWAEAKTIFKSEEFSRTLSFYDSNYFNLYRTLLGSGNVSLALDELLCAAHKKKKVGLKAATSEITYENNNATGVVRDVLQLSRDSWGYSQLTIETVGDFLSVEKKIVWTDDFEGNKVDIEYFIDTDKLHFGTNIGMLRISSLYEDIEIPVLVKNAATDLKSRLSRRRMRYLEMRIFANYIDFRLGKLTAHKLMNEVESSLDKLKAYREESLTDRLIRAWIFIENGKIKQASAALEPVFEKEEWGESILLYVVSMYLKAKLADERTALEILDSLRNLYENSLDARAFLACVYLDKRGRLSNQARYDGFKKSVSGGQHSPAILVEACRIINDEPTVLKSFDNFDLAVIRYGIRNSFININAAMHAVDLAMRQKETSSLMVDTLIKICDQYYQKESLEALCYHLIKGKIVGETAFKWLSAGINEQLNLQNMYESCIISAGTVPRDNLPRGLMTYFANGMDLDDDIKAAFYANVIRQKSGVDVIPLALAQQIKNFTLRKLAEGAIGENLAVLYNNVIDSSDLDEDMIQVLPDIVFKHMIVSQWKNAVSVLVVHKETVKESVYEIVDGCAIGDIYTDNPEVLAQDGHGNRVASEKISYTKLIVNPELIRLCMLRCGDDVRVILNNLESARYRGDSETAIGLVRECIGMQGLEKRFSIECRKELIEYYYENLEGELMENLLVDLDLAALSRQDRSRMIDLMILRELYSLAMKNMELYGAYGVDIKRAAKMASKLIVTGGINTSEAFFTGLCYTVFCKKKSDVIILDYLVKNFNGGSDGMYELWKAALEAGAETDVLEERLLAQLLFTESDMSYSKEILRHYYGHGTNRKLIRAFMSYYAYKYLVKESLADGELLDIMRRDSMLEDNDICTLAVLKFMSGKDKLDEHDVMFVEKKMDALEHKGLIAPFFKNFAPGIRIPDSMHDKQYVEYHTDSAKHVKIHYCLLVGEGDENYLEEDMKDIGYGIFVSEFVVFYGEILQYYITEEDGDGYVITESGELRLEPELLGNEDTGYRQLNMIITAKEMNDSKTMQKLLENYMRNEQLGKKLFKPLF